MIKRKRRVEKKIVRGLKERTDGRKKEWGESRLSGIQRWITAFLARFNLVKKYKVREDGSKVLSVRSELGSRLVSRRNTPLREREMK